MRVLFDTHAFVWWLENSERLSKKARSTIEDHGTTMLVSAASAWELAIKANIGKLNSLSLVVDMPRHVHEESFEELSISVEHAARAGLLPLHHRDPFDRLLVAQAQALNVPILSADSVLDQYDVQRLW
ncbi:MAG TPA: type II toxin-antitoxin system VapC family toxin [Terriglobales bacterium]